MFSFPRQPISSLAKVDVSVLSALFSSLNGRSWTTATNWVNSTAATLPDTACNWHGVSCDGQSRVVYVPADADDADADADDADALARCVCA